jgi:hypothetical protein
MNTVETSISCAMAAHQNKGVWYRTRSGYEGSGRILGVFHDRAVVELKDNNGKIFHIPVSSFEIYSFPAD